MRFYVHNARGFIDQEIEIKKVNFLVGENSTGKTSILGLFDILFHDEFLLIGKVKTSNFGHGPFKELLSTKSDSDYFQLGLTLNVEKKTTDNKEASTIFIVYKFSEKENDVELSGITINANGKSYVSLSFGEKVFRAIAEKPLQTQDVKSVALQQREIFEDVKNKFIEKQNYPFKLSLFAFPTYFNLHDPKDVDELANVFQELIKRVFFNKVKYFSPVRANPRRTYDEFSTEAGNEGEHIPYILYKMLGNDKEETILKKFGRESGLFNNIKIKKLNHEKGSPFSLNLQISKSNILSINQIGYGVSQILPIITELGSNNYTINLIQQPEIHLHPKAQAQVGQFILEIVNEYKQTMFIETHSDFVIDRFRILYGKLPKKRNVDAQVLFFEKGNEGNRITPVEICPNGSYSEDQPKSFREFFIKEQMALMGWD